MDRELYIDTLHFGWAPICEPKQLSTKLCFGEVRGVVRDEVRVRFGEVREVRGEVLEVRDEVREIRERFGETREVRDWLARAAFERLHKLAAQRRFLKNNVRQRTI